MVLAQSMQGLSGRQYPQIWLDSGGMSAKILAQLEREWRPIHRIKSVWELPDEFWRAHPNYIVYRENDSSLNLACSLSGPYNALAVSETLVPLAKAKGLKEKFNVIGRKQLETIAGNKSLFSGSMAVEQPVEKAAFLRDFAVMNNAFVFSAADDDGLRESFIKLLRPGSSVFGWGPDEFKWIKSLSKNGCQGVGSDWCVNLSALARLPVALPQLPAHSPPAPALPGQRIVAFILSDGDNLQWLNGGMAFDQRYFGNPHRGEFAMNWGLSPLLASLSQRTLKYFYDNAKPNDYFCAAGTPGYRYIHEEPGEKSSIDARQLQPLLQTSHLRTAITLNSNAGDLNECEPILKLPEIDGLVYFSFAPYNRLRGQILWKNGKPAVAAKFMLWEKLPECDVESVANAISRLPAAADHDSSSYAIVVVHAWSFAEIGGPIEAVRRTISRLPAGTRVVTLADYFSLLRAHCSPKSFW